MTTNIIYRIAWINWIGWFGWKQRRSILWWKWYSCRKRRSLPWRFSITWLSRLLSKVWLSRRFCITWLSSRFGKIRQIGSWSLSRTWSCTRSRSRLSFIWWIRLFRLVSFFGFKRLFWLIIWFYSISSLNCVNNSIFKFNLMGLSWKWRK